MLPIAKLDKFNSRLTASVNVPLLLPRCKPVEMLPLPFSDKILVFVGERLATTWLLACSEAGKVSLPQGSVSADFGFRWARISEIVGASQSSSSVSISSGNGLLGRPPFGGLELEGLG